MQGFRFRGPADDEASQVSNDRVGACARLHRIPYDCLAHLWSTDLGQDRHDGRPLACERDHQCGLDHGATDLRIDFDFWTWILRLGLPYAWCNRVCGLGPSQIENSSLSAYQGQECAHQYPASLAAQNWGFICALIACHYFGPQYWVSDESKS